MSVGSSPDLYNILNTILSDVAPHNMSELYNISFTDGTSSVSSGVIDLLSFVNKTIGSSGGGGGGGSSAITLAFHYGTFSSSDYSSAYSTVLAATTAGHVYSNSPSGTYTWGTLGLPSLSGSTTTYTWTPTSALTGTEVLIVAGGGGGGNVIGGGGGAGGLVYSASQSISAAQQTIVVGDGGTGGTSSSSYAGSNGTNTSFTGLNTAVGGGGGGGTGKTGGSGGGSGWNVYTSTGSGTANQGYAGAPGYNDNYGGGGGGAGGAGGSASSGAGGTGGIGIDYSSDFTTTYGESGWFASGGGGGARQSVGGPAGTASQGGGGPGTTTSSTPTAAQKHTGGGGSGTGYSNTTNSNGGDGGSGIALVKIPAVGVADITISSGVTDVASTKITQFTSSSVTVSSVVGFLVNDWIMIHQTYYPSGNSNTTTVCPYEFKQIQGISGSVVTFTQSIVGTFIDGAQMIYTYRCNDFTLNSGITITTSNWDQSTYNGGIIPIYADGTVTINGTIDVSGKGYQGISSNYNTSTGGFQDGFQGNGYDNVKRGAGAGGLKGAGGSANSGGGGGGGHLNGGSQGLGSGTNSGNVAGGVVFGSAVGTYLTMGGSGGQGGFHDISGAFQRGGHGGGAVYIQGGSIGGSGSINANGTSGFDNVGVRNYQGGAGGGAGGMVLFKTTSSTFTNATVTGGSGLNGTNGSQQAVTSYRGGDGSLGRFITKSLSNVVNVAFHYGTFSSSDYSSAYSTVLAATTAGHVYSNSPSGTYTWGTLGSPTPTSTNTTYTWTPTSALSGKVLMVAGGGGGGGLDGGGGGAGGVVYSATASISATQQTLVVGNSGEGGDGYSSGATEKGNSGYDTSFTGLTTAVGGGAGAGQSAFSNGGSGGSGGGGTDSPSGGNPTGGTGEAGPPRQGYNGGNSTSTNDGNGAGGGGAGGAGGNSTASVGGTGGIGVDYSTEFTTTYGDSGWYASGGGGGHRSGTAGTASSGGGSSGTTNTAVTHAQKHTGGGGGGIGWDGLNQSNVKKGGDGGSGIILVNAQPITSNVNVAFHYGTFTASDYSSAYSTVLDATTAGHVYSNSPSGTYTWGTLGSPSPTSTNTTYTWTPTTTLTGKVLMVAGGGGGGRRTGGGGGAGGLVFKPSESVSSVQQTIVVGNGGTGASSGTSIGTQGANTTFLGYVANGGGAGSCDAIQTQSSLNGGSGGGAEWNTNAYGVASQPGSSTGGYGNNGGQSNASRVGGAGGGGAGQVGYNSYSSSYGYGGDGLNEVTINSVTYNFATVFDKATYGEDISGESWFAAGGGGGTYSGSYSLPVGGRGGGGNGANISTGLTAGQAHTGGGGGGDGVDSQNGQNGGSGIVIFSNGSSSSDTIAYGSSTVYQYTGSDQTISVPSGSTHIKAILKGAGGGYGGTQVGGDGGYTEAEIELPSGTTSVALIVGQGGDSTVNTTKTYGGGGGSGNDGGATGGRGAGRTALRVGGSAATYSSGFEWGYYNDNYHYGGYSGSQTWFSSRTPVYTHTSAGRSRVTDFSNISTASSGQTSVNGDETYSYLWTGYFKAPITSTYYFDTRSDDNSHMWVGSNALSPTYSNETVDNGGLHGMQTVTSSGVSLTGGVYYDFRMTFGEQGGGDDIQARWRNNSTNMSTNWSTVAFSNQQGGSSGTEVLTAGGGGGGCGQGPQIGGSGGGLIALGGSNPNGGGGTQTTGGSGGVGSVNSGQAGAQYEGGTGSYLVTGWGAAGGGGGWYGGGGGGGQGGYHGAGGGGSGFAGFSSSSSVLTGNERGSTSTYADTTQRTDSVNNCKYQNVKVLRGGGSIGQTSTSGTIYHGVAEISWGSAAAAGGGGGGGGGGSTPVNIVFHYNAFSSSDYSTATPQRAYSTVLAATTAGHVYSNSPSGTYTWGTLGSPSPTSTNTTYTWTPASASVTGNLLIVAGGGGGGGMISSGGGAGGLVYAPGETFSGQQTIVVGNGGQGGDGYNTSTQNGTPGSDSTCLTYTATGGGRGGCYGGNSPSLPLAGGSGGGGANRPSLIGGASTQNTYSGKGFGNAGGNTSSWTIPGGGGGAGGAGGAGSGSISGSGGLGKDYSSTFTTTYGDGGWFASGGGGGCYGTSRTAGTASQGGGTYGVQITSAIPACQSHTGGGGGGGGYNGGSTSQIGSNGGSGVVIIQI